MYEELRQKVNGYAYLWEPEKLQVEFARSLVERRGRAAVVCGREGGNIVEKGRLLIVIPLDGPVG